MSERPGHSIREHEHPIAHCRSQIEVVQCHDHRPVQRPDQIEQFELMPDVEMIGRLVEDEHTGVLRETSGEKHPPTLTAGKRVHRREPVLDHSDLAQSTIDDGILVLSTDAPGLCMWRAAQTHVLVNQQIGGTLLFLRHKGNGFGPRPRGHRVHGVAADTNVTAGDRPETGESTQERRLARSVRTNHADYCTGVGRDVDAFDDGSTVDADNDSGRGQRQGSGAHELPPNR